MERPDNTIFECVAGSHAYGLNTEKSDTDIRGVFMLSPYEHTIDGLLQEPVKQVSDENSDILYFELKRLMELLASNNPTVIELLFMPQDCVRLMTGEMSALINYRHLFVTKLAEKSFGCYARAQLETAKGQNKMVMNPCSVEPPTRESMCYIIHTDGSGAEGSMPMRPVPLSETDIDLSEYHAAACERLTNAFRLYHYGKGAKGVFRGEGTLCCESIPIDDERKRYRYLMVYDESRYETEMKKWKKYWDWMRSRNENRWKDEAGKDRDYDAKKLSHCMRLLYSCLAIARTGAPIVRFEGSERDFLMEIKNGKRTYNEIVEASRALFADIETAYDSCCLPEEVDTEAVRRLYYDLRHLRYSGGY